MHFDESLLLFIIALTAFISPFLSKKLLLPSPVTEILLGIAIGFFIHIDTKSFTIINFLSEFGFIILMYLAGLELDTDDLKNLTKKELIIFTSYFFIIFLLLYISSLIFKIDITTIFILGITAIGLLFPILSSEGRLNSKIGKNILIIGSIGEILSLIIITIFSIYYKYGINTESLFILLEIFFFVLFAYFTLKILKLISWWHPFTVLNITSDESKSETGIRTNFLNMLFFVAVALFFNIEGIIGAFIGGILYSSVFKDKQYIQEGFEIFGNGFLIPVFFITIGINFDFSILSNISVILSALAMTLGIFLVRLLAATIFIFQWNSIRKIAALALGTSFPLTLIVAFSKVGEELNFFSGEIAGSAILTAIFSAVIYPALFRGLLKFII